MSRIASIAAWIVAGMGAVGAWGQPAKEAVLRSEEYNIAVDAPAGWKKEKTPANSLLYLSRTDADMAALVWAEIIPGAEMDPGESLSLWENQSSADKRYKSIREVSRVPYQVLGADGWRARIDQSLEKFDVAFDVWVGAKAGVTYRIAVWGRPADWPQIVQRFDELIAGTNIVREDWSAPSAERIAGTTTLAVSGIMVDFAAGSSWLSAANLKETKAPDVLLNAHHPLYLQSRSFLMPEDAPPEMWRKAAFKRFSVPLDAMDVEALGGENGVLARFEKKSHLQTMPFLMRVWKEGNRVQCLSGWSGIAGDTRLDELRALLLSGRGAAGGPTQEFEESQGETALFLNEIGVELGSDGQHRLALAFYRESLAHGFGDTVMLMNAVGKAVDMGQFREAGEILAEHPALAAKVEPTDLLPRKAQMAVGLGRKEEAVELYEKLFATGYRNDGRLEKYLDLLGELERHQAILDAIEKYGSGNAKSYLSAKTWALAALGRVDEAIEPLRGAETVKPVDWDRVYLLLDVLRDKERYAESLQACLTVLKENPGRGWLWVRKALNEEGLEHLDDAKASIDKAAELLPDAEAVKTARTRISSKAGKGDRALLRETQAVAIPEDLLADIAPDADAERGRGAVVELAADGVVFEPSKTLKWTSVRRVRIADRSGVELMSTIRFSFDGVAERMWVNRLRVTDADGKVTEGNTSAAYVTDAEAGSAKDEKLLVIPAPALAPGCVVEYQVTREAVSPVARLRFDRYWFVRETPVRKHVVWIEANPANLIWKAANLGDRVRTVTRDRGVGFVSDHQLVQEDESQMASAQVWAPWVAISAPGRTWESEGKEYLNEIGEAVGSAADEGVAAEAKQAAGDAMDVAEKVRRVTETVQRAVTYRAVEFGPRAWKPALPAKVWKEKAGDCKDKALLLMTMLKAVGVESRLALINTGGSIVAEVPDRWQFDHMIVDVPALGDRRFVDPTRSDIDAEVATQLAYGGQDVLVLDADKPVLVKVPEADPASNGVRVERLLTVTADGAVGVEESQQLVGLDASWARGLFAGKPRGEFATIARENLTASEGTTVESCEVDGIDGFGAEVRVRLKYALPRAFKKAGDEMVGSIPATCEHWLALRRPMKDRKTPFHFRPFHMETRTTVKGEGVVLDVESGSFTKEAPYGIAQGRIERVGDAVEIRYMTTTRPGDYPAGEFATLVAMREGLLEVVDRPIRARKP